MDSTTIMISLFPIVFVIHELEEILMLEKWKSGKVEMLSHRYPAIARMVSAMSRRGFALIAAEETVLTLAATAIALYGGWQAGWLVRTVHGSRRASVGSHRAVRHPEELRSGLADSHHHIAILYNSIDTHQL